MKLFSISSSSSISGALRRIFCFKTSLPTPNHLHENISEFQNSSDEMIGSKSNPGIVARLMGLDTMPLMETGANLTPKEDICESLEENLVPYPVLFLEHEDDYIVISFEKRSKVRRRRKTKRSPRRFSEKIEEIPPDKEDEKGKENIDPNKDGNLNQLGKDFDSPRNSKFSTERIINVSEKCNCEKNSNGSEQKEALYSSKADKIKEQKSDSENNSPSSVLDIDPFYNYTDPQVVANSEGNLMPGSSNSRREIPKGTDNYEESSPVTGIIDYNKREMINNATLGKICKMAQGDVIKSNWIHIQLRQFEDIEDMVAEWAGQISERLLDELLDQLKE